MIQLMPAKLYSGKTYSRIISEKNKLKTHVNLITSGSVYTLMIQIFQALLIQEFGKKYGNYFAILSDIANGQETTTTTPGGEDDRMDAMYTELNVFLLHCKECKYCRKLHFL